MESNIRNPGKLYKVKSEDFLDLIISSVTLMKYPGVKELTCILYISESGEPKVGFKVKRNNGIWTIHDNINSAVVSYNL